MSAPFNLQRDSFSRLVLTTREGVRHVGIVAVRAFPITAADEGLALVSAEGKEIVWIDRLGDVPDAQRRLIEEELASRDFVPEIRRLREVSSFATPSTWTVATDRGETNFVLRGEEDIRRLGSGGLLVADSHGIQYLIRDLATLDRHSRKLLDRFL